MTYEKWCAKVGIIPDSETREAWDYQQRCVEIIFDKIEDFIIESDDNPKAILHEPYRSLLNKVQQLKEEYYK